MSIITHRSLLYVISGVLIVGSLAALALWGLRPGIDFTGGSVMEFRYVNERPLLPELAKTFSDAGIDGAELQGVGDRGVLARFRNISETEHTILSEKLAGGNPIPGAVFTEERFSSIGPVIGKELTQSSLYALTLVLICIVLYIGWAFRKVSAPVASWKYGAIALVALLHDVVIPTGFFAVLGRFWGVEIDMLFITGLLTILGFSVHDTIVVFDRVRENLIRARGQGDFEEIVGRSVRETFVRSINTSVTVLAALGAVFLFGGESTHFFSLLLIVGIMAGTYSSIFIASPLLVTLERFQQRRMRA